MNVLYGLTSPDAGEIRFDGKPLRLRSPRDAIDAGIGMVHQHFMLIPVMTVTENIVLASEPREGPLLDYGKAQRDRPRPLRALRPGGPARRAGRVDRRRPAAAGRDPEGALPQRAAARARRADRGADAAGDARALRRDAVAQGAGHIDHLHHAQARRGARDRRPHHGAPPRQGGGHRAGRRDVRARARGADGRPSRCCCESRRARHSPARRSSTVRDLVVHDSRGLEAVRGASFEVRAGEIVGLAGVDGNGQSELVEAITGLVQRRRPAASSPRATRSPATAPGPASRPASATSRRIASAAGSCSTSRSPRTSASATSATRPPRASGSSIRARSPSAPGGFSSEFDVRGGGPGTRAGALSGGNQQKVVVAREMSGTRRILVAAQPTRGLDVGAIEFVHQRLVAVRELGVRDPARELRARGDPLAL